ncbi:MAG: hypothetical protein OXC30_00770 [Alphaproteobacteria bacterium]|nr:hypothetical protein [Alphaproteobacteria bacterium]
MRFNFIIFIFCAHIYALPQAPQNHFSVTIDIARKAENAWLAKDQVLSDAGPAGLSLLVEKICFSEDRERCYQALSDNFVEILDSIEVKEQTFFSQTFRGKLHCHYNQANIQKVLAVEKIPFTLQSPHQLSLLIISNTGIIDRDMLINVWKEQSKPHCLTFHTGFDGLEDQKAWREFEQSENIHHLMAHFRHAHDAQAIVVIHYYEDPDRQTLMAHGSCMHDNHITPIFQHPVEAARMKDFIAEEADILNNWWKGKHFSNPWEVVQSTLCHTAKNPEDWFAFSKTIKQHPFVRTVSLQHLSGSTGCLVARFSKCYKKNDKI